MDPVPASVASDKGTVAPLPLRRRIQAAEQHQHLGVLEPRKEFLFVTTPRPTLWHIFCTNQHLNEPCAPAQQSREHRSCEQSFYKYNPQIELQLLWQSLPATSLNHVFQISSTGGFRATFNSATLLHNRRGSWKVISTRGSVHVHHIAHSLALLDRFLLRNPHSLLWLQPLLPLKAAARRLRRSAALAQATLSVSLKLIPYLTWLTFTIGRTHQRGHCATQPRHHRNGR